MRIMTRAEFRDAIRRDMGLPVASDKGGKVGDPAGTHPRPANGLIDQKLSDAVERFNLAASFAVAQNVAVAIPAQTTNGPYAIPLWTLGASAGMPQGATIDVRRVSWDDGGGNKLRLTPASAEAMGRARREGDNTPPGSPTSFWIEGNILYLASAPSAAGTLYLKVGTGVVDFDDDGDVLESFPGALQVGIEYLAVVLIALSQPSDPEMQVLAAAYQPQAEEYLRKAETNRQEQNTMLQARASVYTYRRGGRW